MENPTNYYINGIIWELNHDLPQQVMASNSIVYTTTESSHNQVLDISMTLPQVLQKIQQRHLKQPLNVKYISTTWEIWSQAFIVHQCSLFSILHTFTWPAMHIA